MKKLVRNKVKGHFDNSYYDYHIMEHNEFYEIEGEYIIYYQNDVIHNPLDYKLIAWK